VVVLSNVSERRQEADGSPFLYWFMHAARPHHIDVCPRAKKEIEQLLFETEPGTQTAEDWARLELLAKGMSELETEGQSPTRPHHPTTIIHTHTHKHTNTQTHKHTNTQTYTHTHTHTHAP
jgi:hypothetical protein